MLKKAISLILTVLMVLSVSSVFAASFSDVPSDYPWAEQAILTLADNQIINGYTDGTFRPGQDITKQEAIALFSRILGVTELKNAGVVSLSNVLYEDALKKYDTFAKEEAAYLMYKKVLSEDDLVTYLSAAHKDEPMKRYEAATLIAKCLGGDAWLKKNPDVVLGFDDVAEIPSAARGYVYFASAAEIIQGVGENKFAPMDNVTRAQIAVMLHRMYDCLDYSYVKGVISQVNAANDVISIVLENGETENYKLESGVPVLLDGEKTSIDALPIGQNIVITFSSNSLYSVDVVNMVVDDSFEAIYKGKLTDTSGTTVKFEAFDTGKVSSYKMADDAVILYNDKSASIASLQTGDHVKVSVTSAKVTLIEAKPKTQTIKGARVESISFDQDVMITLTDADDAIGSYAVKSGATIRRNNVVTTFADLMIGDKVDVTLEYGQISAIVAIGIDKEVTGTIEEITISKTTSSLKLNVNGTVTTYAISRDAAVKLDGVAASIYDLRLGYMVKLKTSSATITEVEVKSVATALQITGQIKLVNTAYKMLTLQHTDANGNLTETQVFVKDSAKILDSNDGKIKYLKNLQVGQNVTVAGSDNMGIFEATSIMILANSQ